MPSLHVIETTTDPGSAARPNEDAAGNNSCCAFVIDGATGLSERTVMPPSDAAWLAAWAGRLLAERIGPQSDVRTVVAGMIDDVRSIFVEAAGAEEIPRYAWPSASFALIRAGQSGLEFFGLGDCTVFLRDGAGQVTRHSPLEGFAGWEQQGAKVHALRVGGFAQAKSLLEDAETLADLRRMRALQNTPESGVWTLGLVPEAARQITSAQFARPLPLDIVMCTDGFSALVDGYAALTAEELVQSAVTDGLAPLMGELRRIERDVDPEGFKFPRYKQSDDATAIVARFS